MDYSKQNNEKKRKKIRSNAAKSKKKITFNIFRFTMLAILLIVIVGICCRPRLLQGGHRQCT